MEYLKGVDAMIRLIGTGILISIFCGILWSAVLVLIRLPFGDEVADLWQPYVFALASPLVIRFGLLGGGFSMPRLIGNRQGKRKADTPPSQ